MNQGLTLEEPPKLSQFEHPFLQELIYQIRLNDTFGKYRNWSEQELIDSLIVSNSSEGISPTNPNLDSLNRLLTHAFYNAIGASIERKTEQTTDTFVHLKMNQLSSAVIFCGGVLVLYSLLMGYKGLNFLSLQELIEEAETNIYNAVTKASGYLDLAC